LKNLCHGGKWNVTTNGGRHKVHGKTAAGCARGGGVEKKNSKKEERSLFAIKHEESSNF